MSTNTLRRNGSI